MVERTIKLSPVSCMRSDCHPATLQKAEDDLWKFLERMLGEDFNRVKHFYKVHHSTQPAHRLASALWPTCTTVFLVD